MGELLANTGKRQLAISETQKFGHVTYFWNGNRSGAFDDAPEKPTSRFHRIAIPFEQRPWMKAAEITDALISGNCKERPIRLRADQLRQRRHGRPHRVPSTAARLAVEVVDLVPGPTHRRVIAGARRGASIVTADHGNADQMFDTAKDGSRRNPGPATASTPCP